MLPNQWPAEVISSADKDALILKRVREGVRMNEIAIELNVTPQAVSNRWKKIITKAREQNWRDARELMEIHLERLEFMYQEAIRAWQESCKPINVVEEMVEEDVLGGNDSIGRRKATRKRAESAYGDPRLLEVANSVLKRIETLTGVGMAILDSEQQANANVVVVTNDAVIIRPKDDRLRLSVPTADSNGSTTP